MRRVMRTLPEILLPLDGKEGWKTKTGWWSHHGRQFRRDRRGERGTDKKTAGFFFCLVHGYMIKDLQASPLGRSKSNARGRKDAMLGLHTTYGSLCVGSAAQGKGGSGCGLGRVAHWGLLSSTGSESCLPLKTVGCPWAGHGYIIWSHLIFGLHLA